MRNPNLLVLLLTSLTITIFSCKKKEETINNDTIRFQYFCNQCTVEIKGPNNKYLTTRFIGSIELEEKYNVIVPFTGRVILHSEQPGAFSISASIVGEDGKVKKTVLLTDEKPAAVNLETSFNSKSLTN